MPGPVQSARRRRGVRVVVAGTHGRYPLPARG
jgi:hypothetical protein